MSADLRWEYVPGIGRVLKDGARYRLPEMSEAIGEISKEACAGPGGAACECVSCVARRTVSAGGIRPASP